LAAGEGDMRKNTIHEPAASHSVSSTEFDKILEKVENAVCIIEEALEKQEATMSPKNKGKLAAMCVDFYMIFLLTSSRNQLRSSG
jgi:hypothetical protein